MAKCRCCSAGKIQIAPGRRIDAVASKKVPTRWGERTGGDHVVVRSKFHPTKANCALLCYDEFSYEYRAFPSTNKTADAVEDALLAFAGPENFITTFRSDNADEIRLALKTLKAHPDKGGDVADFQRLSASNDAWQDLLKTSREPGRPAKADKKERPRAGKAWSMSVPAERKEFSVRSHAVLRGEEHRRRLQEDVSRDF